ncbi:hypothetical protein, partial [Stenotrophomonas maltophilia]|uniref:hypothetical protein n=1 Tax=Stenotrophomonas maltophilia TaxID=40324 RepID=UPI003CCFE5C4
PQAPSGRLDPVAALPEVARSFRGLLLVDEAYVDFVDPALGHDSLTLVRTLPNVLLLHHEQRLFAGWPALRLWHR